MAEESRSPRRPLSRYVIAVLAVALLALYLVQALRGKIERIDPAGVALLALTVVFVYIVMSPDFIGSLGRIEVYGFKLERLKRELTQEQERQQHELAQFSLLLPILLPESERKHLKNLAYQRPSDEKGSHDLRSELRRLRSIGLVQMLPDQTVSKIKDGSPVDLSKYMKLTALGRRWVERIADAERVEAGTLAVAANSGEESASSTKPFSS